MAEIIYADSARQMLADLARDDRVDGCHMCVVAIVAKNDTNLEAIAFDEQSPRPFEMVGLLEFLQSVVISDHIQRPEEQ